MNTLEFKAAIRPQLERQVWGWFYQLDLMEQRNVGVAFRQHVYKVFCDEKACRSLIKMVDELPVSLKTSAPSYLETFTKHFLDLFFIYVARYQHLDRSAGTSLLIHAYQHRVKNALIELRTVAASAAMTAHGTIGAKVRKSPHRDPLKQTVLYSQCGPVENLWGRAPQVPRLFQPFASPSPF